MPAPVETMDRKRLLDRFQAKARCSYTNPAATSLFIRLREHLTPSQARALAVAWGHIKDCHEGPEELDEACAEIRKEWTA